MKINRRILEERIFLVITGLVAALVASILILIIGYITWVGLPLVNLQYLTTEEISAPFAHAIGNAILGTILIGTISVVLATPLSVATAVYMKRYAKDNSLTRLLSFLLDVLSGTPSIIMGLFGYLILVLYLRSITGGYSLMSGSIALALLIMPVIERAAESAIDTVPAEFEHASLALGSNLWQTIKGITLPYAFPGIVTGIILGIGRACEESAVVKLTAGYSQYFPKFGLQPSNKLITGIDVQPLNELVGTLPITIYNNYAYSSKTQDYIFAAAFVLIVVVMSINLLARFVTARFQMGVKKRSWFRVAQMAGGQKIFKRPVNVTASLATDGGIAADGRDRVGKFVSWLTTDPKKAARENADGMQSASANVTTVTSIITDHPPGETKPESPAPADLLDYDKASIYSPEAINKATEAMDKSDTSMPPEATISRPEKESHPEHSSEEGSSGPSASEPSKELTETVTPAPETPGNPGSESQLEHKIEIATHVPVEDKPQTSATVSDDQAPAHEVTAKPEPAPEKAPELPGLQKAENGKDKIETFVKWLTTDPKKADRTGVKEPAKSGEVSVSGQQATDNTAKGKYLDNRQGLEIIPPRSPLKEKPGMAENPNLVKYPANGIAIPAKAEPAEIHAVKAVKTDKQADRLVKWLLTDPKKAEANKAAPGDAGVEAQQVPAATSVEKKRSDIVKWLLTDPKKEKSGQDNVAGMHGEGSAGAPDSPVANRQGSRKSLSLPGITGLGTSKHNNDNQMPEFMVGKLSQPSLEESIRNTDFTYAIDPPFQYVRIFFDGEELVYNVLEPALGEAQKRYMAIIERGLEKLISSKIVAIKPEEREQFLRAKFDEIIDLYGWKLNREYRDRMFFFLRKRYLGYDRIDAIMKDHYIEDISCNGPNAYVYIFHRIYGSVRTNVAYGDVELNKFVMRMAQISGRHISILQPIKDISLPDGSRANLTLGTEVTKKGATFTIRKFKDRPISPIELLDYGSVDTRALAYLWTLVDYKRSILVSGGTASGKTTLMNALCSFIRPELKIVSLEDTPELNLVHPNWIQSVTRSGFGAESGGGAESVSGISGVSAKSPGNIGLYDLLVAALRQRPEYILVGEVRGAEAFTLFQAIAVGHAAMGTIHAGNMRELLSRVESNPMNLPRTLFAAMDVVCFSAMIRRGDRNVRRIMQIVEILELDTEGNLITNPVFRWDAFSDRFVFSGKSHIFEKIESQLGVRQESLVQEMDRRAAFLKKLRDDGVRDYTTVVENIREYELSKITGDQKS